MKVLVFNVKYSPNLGDGILAECLEMALRESGPDLTVETIDIAGRHCYGEVGRGRMGALAALRLLPPVLSRNVVAMALSRRLPRLAAEWQARIAEADAVVIGGGNLFQDDDLNFPLKIGTVLDCVRNAGKPLAVFAVGVSSHWSDQAAHLFGRIRSCRVVHVSVRDGGALENWTAHFGDRLPAEILPDPGLLACGLLPAGQKDPPAARPVVGLCVTHPLVLRRHAGGARNGIPLAAAGEYRELAAWLIRAGSRVLFFSNGAIEDQRFLEEALRDRFWAARIVDGSVVVAPRPQTPAELIAILKRANVIVAHRLHAGIAAYSLGTPTVGLGWDQKVRSFFTATGREEFFIGNAPAGPERIGSLVVRAMREGVDRNAHRSKIREARRAVERLADVLQEASRCGISQKITTTRY